MQKNKQAKIFACSLVFMHLVRTGAMPKILNLLSNGKVEEAEKIYGEAMEIYGEAMEKDVSK